MPQKRKLDDVANNPELTRLANQIFEPKRTDGGFAARSIVCLSGLVSAPELNGRMALVVREMDSGGRMTVTLSGEMNPVPFGGLAIMLAQGGAGGDASICAQALCKMFRRMHPAQKGDRGHE